VWVVSAASPRLPLLIEDAMRPADDEVNVVWGGCDLGVNLFEFR